MIVNKRGNPVSRDEYENLLQRVIALEEMLLQSDNKQIRKKREEKLVDSKDAERS